MRWIVISPEYTYVEVVCAEGGPSFIVRDAALVDAPNQTEARWAFLRWARSRHQEWAEPGYLHNGHPLKGIRCEKAGSGDTPEAWGDLYVNAMKSQDFLDIREVSV